MILLCSQDGELLSHSKKVQRTSTDGLQQRGTVLMTGPGGRMQAVGGGHGGSGQSRLRPGHPGVEVSVKNDPGVMGILQQPS